MSRMTTIAIACDPGGFPLREALIPHLQKRHGTSILDLGMTSRDDPIMYPLQAPKVARAVQSGEADLGIICCGTGQGMAIVANKFKGIYAAVADSIYAAEQAAAVNNANVITMGGLITAPLLATRIVDTWLDTEFTKNLGSRAGIVRSNFEAVRALEDEICREDQ